MNVFGLLVPLKLAVTGFIAHLCWALFDTLQFSGAFYCWLVCIMVFGVLSGPFLTLGVFKRDILTCWIGPLLSNCRLDDFLQWTFVFFTVLDLVELHGGQGASGPGLMVHQALKYWLHNFSESEGSPVGGGSDKVGNVTAVGFPQLWVSRLGRGVWLILLAPLCNTQTQRAFPSLTFPSHPFLTNHHQLKVHTLGSLTKMWFPGSLCEWWWNLLFRSVCQRWQSAHNITHTVIMLQRVCLSVSLALTHVIHSQWRNGGTLVDQCLCEAVICLAPVLLQLGRWDGYPYPPSGQPGMDKMQPWPSAERDQRITAPRTIPAVQLFLWTCRVMRVRPCDQRWHPSRSTFHVQAWFEPVLYLAFARTVRLVLHLVHVWLHQMSLQMLSLLDYT